MTCLTIIVTLQALSLVAVFAFAGYSHLRSSQLSQQHSSSLELETNSLKMELNQTVGRREVEIETYLGNLQTLINTLNTTVMDQLKDLQSTVNMLNTTTVHQLNVLQYSVNTLNATTMGKLSDFQPQPVNSLMPPPWTE